MKEDTSMAPNELRFCVLPCMAVFALGYPGPTRRQVRTSCAANASRVCGDGRGDWRYAQHVSDAG